MQLQNASLLIQLSLAIFCMEFILAKEFTFINKGNSTIKLKPVFEGKEFTFRLLSNGENGNAIIITNKNKEKLHFELKQEKIHLRIRDSDNQPIATRVFNHVIKQWNDVRIKEIKYGLYVIVNNEETAILLKSANWDVNNWIEANLGFLPSYESFIGCVDIHTTTGVGSSLKQRNDVMDGCINACSFQTCENGGKCINNYRNVKCDCIGTGYDGPACERESPTFKMTKTNYIKSNQFFSNPGNHQIHLITFRFKTISRDNDLFQSTISDRHMKVTLRQGSLHVVCQIAGGRFQTNIGDNLDDNRWHSFSMSLHKEHLNIKIDHSFKTTANTKNLASSPKSSAKVANTNNDYILIGRADEKGTSSFTGCLQQVYINNINVIPSMKDNKRLFSYAGMMNTC